MSELLHKIHMRHYVGSDVKALKARKSELTTAMKDGLHEHVFDQASFNAQKAKVTTNLRNKVKALCNLLKAAEPQELADMYLASVDNFDDAHEADMEDITFMLNHKDMPLRVKNAIARFLLKNKDVPDQVKKDMLDRKTRHLRELNTENAGASFEKSREKLKEGASEKEKKNWIDYRELKEWHELNKDSVKGFLRNEYLSEANGNIAYFHSYLSINVFSERTARADVAGIMIRNHRESEKKDEHQEKLDSIFIDPEKQDLIIVNRGNKTRSKYTWDVTGIDPEVMQLLINRAKAMGSDYLFPPLRARDYNVRYDSFIRTCVGDVSKAVFGRRLNTHLVRRIVATHDFQEWYQNGKGDLQAFIQNADKMDHSLRTHLQSYIYTEMFDPQLETGVSTGSN
ncbi:hypothetical protein HK097_009898 [Rhizophlyctis rosea]|uniref:Uncharacterized protein n=1 Tax=Rhizophlyctis rosea TaxID=64517 RepID=A0AAD5S9W0_9FUNG|nr:hypothetical protein HK097_009898 [Rhizophlyctis rosea]